MITMDSFEHMTMFHYNNFIAEHLAMQPRFSRFQLVEAIQEFTIGIYLILQV